MIYTPGLKVSSVSRTLERNNSVNLFELTCVTLGVGGGATEKEDLHHDQARGTPEGLQAGPTVGGGTP